MTPRTGLLRLWLVLLIDILLINMAFLLAALLRFGGIPPADNLEALFVVLPWGSVAVGVILFSLGLYEQQWTLRVRIVRTLVIASVVNAGAYAAISYWTRGFAVPRSVVVLAVPIMFLLLLTWRMLLNHVAMIRSGGRPMLVVGSADEVSHVVSRIERIPGDWFRVVGRKDPQEIVADREALSGVDVLVLCQSVEHHIKEELLLRAAETGVTVFAIPDLLEIMVSGQVPKQLADIPVLVYEPFGLTPAQSFEKRVVDLLLGVPALILSLPLMALIAVMIKATSPGPAILRQDRVGLNGRVFKMYKFRTMVDNAEAGSGPVLSWDDDPRITGLGGILRRMRLDELPQILNVLKGEMSLVGPRPERPELMAEIVRTMPDFKYRVLVPPGITGLAQVMGLYSTEPVDKLRFDLLYMRNYSLWLDLTTMFRTLVVLLDRTAARGVSRAPRSGHQNAPERPPAVASHD